MSDLAKATRLQVVRLQTLWGELVQLGRTRGLFGQAEAVKGQPSSDSAVAFVRAMRGMSEQPVRTEATEVVSADGLRRAVARVAEELAARLDQEFGGQYR